MKKLFFILALFAVASVQAQTAEEIVKNYANAIGGLDAFNKAHSAKMTGSLLIQGNEYPITIQIINGTAYRLDADMNGTAIVQVYHNGSGWKVNPFGGGTTPVDLTGVELIDTKTQASLATQLMDYKARGHQIELLGKDTIEGVPVYKIKFTSKEDGRVTTYNLTTSEYLPLKVSQMRQIQGQDMQVDSYYSNFKEFDGLKFSLTRIQKIGDNILQELDLEKIELNVPVDEKIFDKP